MHKKRTKAEAVVVLDASDWDFMRGQRDFGWLKAKNKHSDRDEEGSQ